MENPFVDAMIVYCALNGLTPPQLTQLQFGFVCREMLHTASSYPKLMELAYNVRQRMPRATPVEQFQAFLNAYAEVENV